MSTNNEDTTRLGRYLERAAAHATDHGLDAFAAGLRDRVGKAPTKSWTSQLAKLVPADRDDRAAALARRLAERFTDPGNRSVDDAVYQDVIHLRNTPVPTKKAGRAKKAA